MSDEALQLESIAAELADLYYAIDGLIVLTTTLDALSPQEAAAIAEAAADRYQEVANRLVPRLEKFIELSTLLDKRAEHCG